MMMMLLLFGLERLTLRTHNSPKTKARHSGRVRDRVQNGVLGGECVGERVFFFFF